MQPQKRSVVIKAEFGTEGKVFWAGVGSPKPVTHNLALSWTEFPAEATLFPVPHPDAKCFIADKAAPDLNAWLKWILLKSYAVRVTVE